MPNGFHGSREAWERLEAPLRLLDLALEAFAHTIGVPLTRSNNWPQRSFRWDAPVSRLIQLYLEDEDRLTWTLWVCASEDRASGRYWRRQTLRRDVPIEEISSHLSRLLDQAYQLVTSWSSKDLEFATDLSVPPAV